MILQTWQFLMIVLAEWTNRQQQGVIVYFQKEDRVLREQLKGRSDPRCLDTRLTRFAPATISLGGGLTNLPSARGTGSGTFYAGRVVPGAAVLRGDGALSEFMWWVTVTHT